MKTPTLTIVASLVCWLGLQTVGTAAATATPAAGASAALQGKVRIHLDGTLTGPQFRAIGRGRFVLTGAISDRGSFVDRFQGTHPPADPYVRRLRGAKGTIWIIGDGFGRGKGHWRVTKGTKAYAGLRGRGGVGPGHRRYGHGDIDLTIVGTVWK
jgi:hypothetical protein